MKHNYTVLITGELTKADHQVEHKNLAVFAFADNDPGRIAELEDIARDGKTVQLKASCLMLGHIELCNKMTGGAAVFHFHLDELQATPLPGSENLSGKRFRLGESREIGS